MADTTKLASTFQAFGCHFAVDPNRIREMKSRLGALGLIWRSATYHGDYERVGFTVFMPAENEKAYREATDWLAALLRGFWRNLICPLDKSLLSVKDGASLASTFPAWKFDVRVAPDELVDFMKYCTEELGLMPKMFDPEQEDNFFWLHVFVPFAVAGERESVFVATVGKYRADHNIKADEIAIFNQGRVTLVGPLP
jgi:hypothetical protein